MYATIPNYDLSNFGGIKSTLKQNNCNLASLFKRIIRPNDLYILLKKYLEKVDPCTQDKEI